MTSSAPSATLATEGKIYLIITFFTFLLTSTYDLGFVYHCRKHVKYDSL